MINNDNTMPHVFVKDDGFYLVPSQGDLYEFSLTDLTMIQQVLLKNMNYSHSYAWDSVDQSREFKGRAIRPLSSETSAKLMELAKHHRDVCLDYFSKDKVEKKKVDELYQSIEKLANDYQAQIPNNEIVQTAREIGWKGSDEDAADFINVMKAVIDQLSRMGVIDDLPGLDNLFSFTDYSLADLKKVVQNIRLSDKNPQFSLDEFFNGEDGKTLSLIALGHLYGFNQNFIDQTVLERANQRLGLTSEAELMKQMPKDSLPSLNALVIKVSSMEDLERLEKLLQDIDLEQRDNNFDRNTPLMNVCESHYELDMVQIKLIKTLIEAGADVNSRNADNYTSLDIALERDNLEVAELLIQNGAEFKNTGEVIDVLKRENDGSRIQRLIDYGIDINTPSSEGKTLLEYASENQKLEVATVLIENGSEVSDTALQQLLLAAEQEDNKSLRELLIKQRLL